MHTPQYTYTYTYHTHTICSSFHGSSSPRDLVSWKNPYTFVQIFMIGPDPGPDPTPFALVGPLLLSSSSVSSSISVGCAHFLESCVFFSFLFFSFLCFLSLESAQELTLIVVPKHGPEIAVFSYSDPRGIWEHSMTMLTLESIICR